MLAHLAEAMGPDWRDRVEVFGSKERTETLPGLGAVRVRALATITPADVADAAVVHLAYLTKDKVEALGDTEFFATNQTIDDQLLRALEGAQPRAVFVASSGAAADAERGVNRHLYGVTKLLQEDRFLDFGRRSGAPVLAGRIFNLAGPHINKLESYAVSAFLLQAFETGRIRIEARVPVYRSYLHVTDLADLVRRALLNPAGTPAHTVDLCGTEVVEMSDVAAAAARAVGLAKDRVERGAVDFERPSAYLGDSTQTRTLALRNALRLRDFATQVADTAAFMRSAREA